MINQQRIEDILRSCLQPTNKATGLRQSATAEDRIPVAAASILTEVLADKIMDQLIKGMVDKLLEPIKSQDLVEFLKKDDRNGPKK